MCRYCCKSLFAPLIKNSPGYRRDVRVNMWGTSSPDDKLVSDLAKATEAIKIAARRSDRLMAGKLSPLNFGLLQQYLPLAVISRIRGREASYLAPPAQIRTCGFPAYGSHLGSNRQSNCRMRSGACDTLMRLCVRRVLCQTAFPLVPALRSTNSAADRSALFAGFPATMAGSDFSCPCIIGYGSSPSRCGPSLSRDADGQTRDLPASDAIPLHVVWP